MKAKLAFVLVLLCLGAASILNAQDAVKVDPKHYSVVSENDQVRILKVHYGPHEKSVMHSHPNTVAVFLTEGNVQFTFPDGKTESHPLTPGQSQFSEATTHLPENTTGKPMDAIVIELKNHAAKQTAKAAAKPAESTAKAAAKPAETKK